MRGGQNRGKGKTFKWLQEHAEYQGLDCLPWPFCREKRSGRGCMGHNGRNYWAHRLMCELAHGPPPTDKHEAAHICGKGAYGCVNPRHLAWKTTSENQLDRRKTGGMLRNRYGNRSVLKPDTIAAIVALKGKKPQVETAKMFGVSLGCVQYWQHERNRRHIKRPPVDQQIDAALADGPMPFLDLARKLYPNPKSWRNSGRSGGPACLASLGQALVRYGFEVRDRMVFPRLRNAA